MKRNGLKARATPKVQRFPPPASAPVEGKQPPPRGSVKKWGFTLFVALWMFVLGIWVGRETTPVHVAVKPIKTELTRLREAEKEKDRLALQEAADELKETELGFYDDLTRETPRTWTEQVEPPPVEPPAEIEVKRSLSKKSIGPLKIKTIRPEEREPPAEKAAPAPEPAAPKPKPSPGPEPAVAASPPPAPPKPAPAPAQENVLYAIQVASFALQSDSDRMVDELRRKGYGSVYQTSEEVGGIGIRYRVKVGDFRERNQAATHLKRLREEEGLMDAYIFQRK